MKIKQTNKEYYSKNNGYWIVSTLPIQKAVQRIFTVASPDHIYFKFDKSIDFKRHKHAHTDNRHCSYFTVSYKQ